MTFINLPVKDLAKATEFLTRIGDAQDEGFMYMRGFRDLDGHQWSFIYMDMAALQG
jgi:predicted lactoylglutathione lyase